MAHQIVKARVGAEQIDARFALKIDDVTAAILKGLFQPAKRLVFIAEADGNRHHINRGDVPSLRKIHQLREQLGTVSFALAGTGSYKGPALFQGPGRDRAMSAGDQGPDAIGEVAGFHRRPSAA